MNIDDRAARHWPNVRGGTSSGLPTIALGEDRTTSSDADEETGCKDGAADDGRGGHGGD
jgi:hypothetical protein